MSGAETRCDTAPSYALLVPGGVKRATWYDEALLPSLGILLGHKAGR